MARLDPTKMVLTAEARGATRTAHAAAAEEFLERGLANVIGLAEGIKWRNGEPTGEPALVVLVTGKVAQDQLTARDLVPAQVGGMQTDVLDVGHVFAGGEEMAQGAGAQTLATRIRPAQGGL